MPTRHTARRQAAVLLLCAAAFVAQVVATTAAAVAEPVDGEVEGERRAGCQQGRRGGPQVQLHSQQGS